MSPSQPVGTIRALWIPRQVDAGRGARRPRRTRGYAQQRNLPAHGRIAEAEAPHEIGTMDHLPFACVVGVPVYHLPGAVLASQNSRHAHSDWPPAFKSHIVPERERDGCAASAPCSRSHAARGSVGEFLENLLVG